jgi:hypothetical protein
MAIRRNVTEVSMFAARPILFAFAAGLALAAATFAPLRAAARTSFDGNWSVVIVTDRGQCDRAYRYGVTIRNGSVLYEGGAAVNVAGRVSGNGQVNVRLWAGSQSATGNGRLSRNYGTGRWSGVSSSGSCSGTWSAERR